MKQATKPESEIPSVIRHELTCLKNFLGLCAVAPAGAPCPNEGVVDGCFACIDPHEAKKRVQRILRKSPAASRNPLAKRPPPSSHSSRRPRKTLKCDTVKLPRQQDFDWANRQLPAGITRKDVCIWTQDSDGPWNTSCGVTWEFNDGGPAENRAHFCHHCGGVLLSSPFEEFP